MMQTGSIEATATTFNSNLAQFIQGPAGAWLTETDYLDPVWTGGRDTGSPQGVKGNVPSLLQGASE